MVKRVLKVSLRRTALRIKLRAQKFHTKGGVTLFLKVGITEPCPAALGMPRLATQVADSTMRALTIAARTK